MADFCRQCSIDNFGKDYEDHKGLTDSESWEKGLAATVICEGCGFIQVDPEGNCVSQDCMCKGKSGHGLPWTEQEQDEESK